MAKKTNGPFTFDPTKMAEDFTGMLSQYKVPGLDYGNLMESQRKNVEALTAANQAAVEGAQSVAQRQAEIVQQTLEEAAAAFQDLSKSDTPQAATAKQTDFVKKAFESALENMRELAEMSAKANEQAAKAINARIVESLDEFKQQIASGKA